MSVPPPLPPLASWDALVERALAEDLGSGDVTTRSVLAPDARMSARIVAREPLVACGLPVVLRVFERLGGIGTVVCTVQVEDGARVATGEPLAQLSGSAQALLAGERTALNFLSRLCGISTRTRTFVDTVAGTGAEIVDTRKTLPGWRVLDKYAVAVGGGTNHRGGLYDALLVKDNHVAAAGGVAAAVKAARAAAPRHLWLQVEVESAEQARQALDAGADALLLDNRSIAELRELVARFRDETVLEASGGITLDGVRSVAETGVQRISIGALTHSAPHVDVALDASPGAEGPAPGAPA